MDRLDDDIRLPAGTLPAGAGMPGIRRRICDRVSSVHEPHRKKWQLAQTRRVHWNILELRKPGDPALRVMWYW